MVFRDALSEDIDADVRWIIGGLLAEGEQLLLCGAPKVGKSQFAMQMAVAISMGKPFHDWSVEEPRRRKVLYVNLEIGERPFMRRLAAHVLAELGKVRMPASKEAIGKDLKAVNEEISGSFFFSEELRFIGITRDHIEGLLNSQKEPGTERDKFLKEWHRVMDELTPELVIFDTLSKMHTLDERENNAIQGVLMLIRQMATVKSEDEAVNQKRQEVAHVVVHHSRKSSDDGRVLKKFVLDSIRGGSAIRAEADVIIGLSGQESPGEILEDVERWVTIEARNIAGGQFDFQFNGFRFEKKSGASEKKKAENYSTRVLAVFKELGVRGVSTGLLTEILSNNNKQRSSAYEAEKKRLMDFAKGKDLIRLKASENKALIAKWPVKKVKHSAEIYWIGDDSDWLKDENLLHAIEQSRANLKTE